MEKLIVENIDELFQIWESEVISERIELEQDDHTFEFYDEGVVNMEINFELKIPFPKEASKKFEDILRGEFSYRFRGCIFLKSVSIGSTEEDVEFTEGCKFKSVLKSNGNDKNLTLRDCTIQDVNFENANFGSEEIKADQKGKVRFRNCDFFDTNFKNTTFNSLADFWACTFYKPVTFYKTDFKNIVVFSAVTFKENVLFTYTLIEKLMILRGAYPEKGIDLSLAIIAGELSIFDFQFDDYSAYGKIYKDVNEEIKKYPDNDDNSFLKAYEAVYENAVSNEHLIPLENKRETYRILKNQLESQKNFIDAVPFRVMENKTLLKESVKKLVNGNTFWRPLSNIIVLVLNALSNWFGSSYLLGLVFTVSIAGIFFNLALSHIGDFVFTWNYEEWQWQYFVQFINPTHRFDYMKLVDENPRKWFFIWDFLGRIFVGYGIYQTIQAFRKYK